MAGFVIVPAEKLSLFQALAGPAKAHLKNPEKLKYVLAPLVANNKTEQERFYEIFDQWYKTNDFILPSSVNEQPLQRLFLSRTISRILLILLILLIPIFFIIINNPVIVPPTADSTIIPNAVGTKVPLNIKPLIKGNLESVFVLSPVTWLLFLLGAIALLYFWIRLLIRKPKVESQGALTQETEVNPRFAAPDKAPYFIPFRNQEHAIRPAQEFFRLSDILRIRQQGLRQDIDVPTSVHATLKGGGFPTLYMKYSTQPSEYLFLIEEPSPASHQAHLFRFLANTLEEREVHLEVFYYKKDLNRLWNTAFPKGIGLETVQRIFPNHRLVVLGDGHSFLNPHAQGKPAIYSDLELSLRTWKQRFLLTPQPPISWTYCEGTLHQLFVIFPIDLKGIEQFSAFIESGLEAGDQPPSFALWHKHLLQQRADADINYQQWRTLEAHRNYCKNAPELLLWLCALSVYPNPTWEVTIAIGKALETKGVVVNHDTLLQLSRIPWLQNGNLHPKLQTELLHALPSDAEQLARQAVQKELNVVASISENGFANFELQSNLAIQNFALAPDNAAHRETLQYLLNQNLINKRQENELNQIVQRKQGNDFTSKILGTKPSTIREYLNQPEPIKQDSFFRSRSFYRAASFTLLYFLLFFGAWVFHGNKKLQRALLGEPTRQLESTEAFKNYFFIKETLADSAALYNNNAVDKFYANHNEDLDSLQEILQYQEKYGAEAVQLLQNARRKKYQLAEDNLGKLHYNLGIQQYKIFELNKGVQPTKFGLNAMPKEKVAEQNDAPSVGALQKALPYFYNAQPFTLVKREALHAIGIIKYYLNELDSARYYYNELLAQTNNTYFDTLQTKPNLSTLLAATGNENIAIVADRDKDGVPDNEDLCPDEPGTIANKGCKETSNTGSAQPQPVTTNPKITRPIRKSTPTKTKPAQTQNAPQKEMKYPPTDSLIYPGDQTQQSDNEIPTKSSKDYPVPLTTRARKPIWQSCYTKNLEIAEGEDLFNQLRKADACTEDRIRNYIQKKLGTSFSDKKSKAAASYTIKFTVNEKGGAEFDALSPNDRNDLENAIRKILEEMPAFIPGQNSKGAPIRVSYLIPIAIY